MALEVLREQPVGVDLVTDMKGDVNISRLLKRELQEAIVFGVIGVAIAGEEQRTHGSAQRGGAQAPEDAPAALGWDGLG